MEREVEYSPGVSSASVDMMSVLSDCVSLSLSMVVMENGRLLWSEGCLVPVTTSVDRVSPTESSALRYERLHTVIVAARIRLGFLMISLVDGMLFLHINIMCVNP